MLNCGGIGDSVWIPWSRFGMCGLYLLRRRELQTTEIELRAIAMAANIGDRTMPLTGYSTPIATGIRQTLYMNANMKLILIRSKVFLAIIMAYTTSERLSFIRTMPAAPTVMSEAELIAQPTFD